MIDFFSPSESNAVQNTLNNRNYSMRVVLIADNGGFFTILLPATMEGRYRFTDSNGNEKYPFFCEAVDGNWCVNLGAGVYFQNVGSMSGFTNSGRAQILSDRVALKFSYNGQNFIIYPEIERLNDHVFLPYYIEERTDYVIGRSESNHICYNNPAVSREHACLHWNGSSWTIIDQNSTNGTCVNGKFISSAELNVGDIVFIVGLYIIIGQGYICINNKNDRCVFNSPRIRHITGMNDISYSKPNTNLINRSAFFDRKPRKIKPLTKDPIEIEMPPMPLNANNIPFLLRLGTPMLMGGSALMSGNILMAMTSMVLPTITQSLTEKDRKEYESKRLEGYRRYLEFIKTRIQNEKLLEERTLNYNYPSLVNNMQLISGKNRMWERRKSDDDFISVRLGFGSYPMIVEKKYAPKKFQIEPDILENEMYQIAEQTEMLNNVPVMISLLRDYIVGMCGDRQGVLKLIRNMIIQLACAHSYDDLKIVIVADKEEAKFFDFVRYLPHNWNDEKNIRFFVSSQSEAQQLTTYFNKIKDNRPENSVYNLVNEDSYIVFDLSKSLYNYIETFKDVMKSEKYEGISIVAAFDGLPKECVKVIDLTQGARIVDYLHPEADDQYFELDAYDENLAKTSVQKLVETKVRMDCNSFILPKMVTFLEMFGVGQVEYLNPLQRWADNNPVKTLATPIGVGTDGNLFNLDLHEKHHGPHGLVAGMTGSGKSEFLITYILSMAVNYSPDEVAFVLIDYKGGGLADAFEDKTRGIHLPHLVGTITNLDGAAIQRSLMSIKSELKRRQAVFKKAKSQTNEGTMDIYDYQKLYRSGRVSEPMPHLIIISDEFAEMKTQQPEFMQELISTARIGRSLGVHLILATQKPAGVVNDQIRSNTKFQVCLKVQDRSDSMDMIKRPDAAELKQTGRFYLQVGYNEFFALGQSAWCGAEYIPQEEVTNAKDSSIKFIDNVGQTLMRVEPKVEQKRTGTKQIVAIVQYLSDLANRENIEPRSLWLEPLPKQLDYDEFMQEHGQSADGYLNVALGMVDDPEKQSQFPLVLDFLSFHHMLVCSGSGFGKSTLIRTILLSLAEKYSPQEFNYYIIDFSSGSLSSFEKLPHCGAYLNETQEGDIKRLFSFIKDLVDERKKIFSQSDVTNYEAYCKIGKLPMILFVIDGYATIKTIAGGMEIFNFLQDDLRDTANYGIKFVLTTNHPNDVSSKTKQEIDYSIALNAKDKYEYGDILGTRCTFAPPEAKGRGLCVVDSRALEYQVAMPDVKCSEQEQASLLRQRLSAIAEKYSDGTTARRLPVMKEGQEYTDFIKDFGKNCFPLGYSTLNMKQVVMPLHQLYCMSLYFGNPNGVKPVLSNIINMAKHNDMDIVVMRKQNDTLFDSQLEYEMKQNNAYNVEIIDPVEEGLARLDDILIEEITSRNVYRDEFCRNNGIDLADKGKLKRSSRYICANTRPLIVIFESYFDFLRIPKDENMIVEISTLLSRTKGYNIYFAGCFYPNEEGMFSNNPILKCFNKDDLLLLFGGQYDKQSFTNLPMDLRRFEQMNPKFDRYMLKYRGEFHPLFMPCGVINSEDAEPDEAPII